MIVTTHRLVRRSIAALAIVALPVCIVLARPTRPAWACSCIGLNDQQAFDWADVAFRGEFIGYASPFTEQVTASDQFISSMGLATWTFAVLEVYKGEVAAEVDVLSPWSGASCGLELPHEGEVYVFARVDPGSSDRPSNLHAGLCGGTRSVVEGPLAVEGVTPMPAATVAQYIPVDTEASPTTSAADDAVPAAPTAVATAGPDDGSVGSAGNATGAIPLAALGLVTLAGLAGAVALAVRRGM